MGALEEASQRQVQGFGIKVSSFPSPGASPTATRTTVNMLLTVLAITRWVTLDTSAHSCQAGRECPWPRPRGTSGPLWSLAGGCFRWWQKQVCSGIPRMSFGRSWARDGSGARCVRTRGRGVILGNRHLLWFSWASGNKDFHWKTEAPDAGCPHLSQIHFPFLLFTPAVSSSPFFSPWVTDSPPSSSSHGTALCCISL